MAVPQHAEVLNVETCWELLEAGRVGRIAVDIAGQPDIFPINYAVDGETLVFRTRAGTKLAGAAIGCFVALEIDGVDPVERTVWSVVVKGTAREITRAPERDAARRLPLIPWVAELTPEFVRIEPLLVTGRRFGVVNEARLTATG